jgi:predicted molibdopterin-dependent oxidoreductase YjgC
VAVALDALLVAHGPGKGLAQGDADVLHRVVRIDVQVALGVNAEIHHPVAGDLVEHVLEKRQTRVEIGLAAAVEAHRNADLRLQRVAADLCAALCHGVFHSTAEIAAGPAARKTRHYR